MQKIMFSDKFGLTQAVIDGRKTMTRRFVGKVWLNDDGSIYEHSPSSYKIGEVVAVAQSYSSCIDDILSKIAYTEDKSAMRGKLEKSKGWNNKMFVRADLMPYRIKITNIRTERLHDISDDDCLKEGVLIADRDCEPFYIADNYGKPLYGWFDNPREVFSFLIDKVSGCGTWDRNPWVFVYEFELE